MAATDTIEAQGHLIDSGLLSAIFDKIIEFKASYEILTFDIGRTNDDPSRIEMRINAADTAVLYMAASDAAGVKEALLAAGLSASTPVAIAESVSSLPSSGVSGNPVLSTSVI